MSDTTADASTDAVTETPAAVVEAPATVSDQLPEWAREKLTKANSEAANYRTQRNELQEKLDQAMGYQTERDEALKLAEETKSALEAKDLQLLKLRAALSPNDPALIIAERINGTTPDEIAADAQVVRELFAGARHTPAVDPSPAGSGAPVLALNDDDGLKAKLESHMGIKF